MTKRYVCIGSVRGWCGVRHRTEKAALACCRSDHRGCASQGGYSDRTVQDAEELPWEWSHLRPSSAKP